MVVIDMPPRETLRISPSTDGTSTALLNQYEINIDGSQTILPHQLAITMRPLVVPVVVPEINTTTLTTMRMSATRLPVSVKCTFGPFFATLRASFEVNNQINQDGSPELSESSPLVC